MIKKPIILIGLMGAGKTVTGKMLASKMGVPFYDTDDLIIEKEGMSVSDIFERHGEPYFRACETKCLESQNWNQPFIMATGGGLFITPTNQEILRKKADVVYLSIPMKQLKKRLADERAKRPLLNNDSWESILISLATAREEAYRKAHWTYEISDEPVETVADNIITHLQNSE